MKCCAFWRKFSQAGLGGGDNWCFAATIKSPFPAQSRQMDVYIFTSIQIQLSRNKKTSNTTIKKQKTIQIQLSRNKTGNEKYKYNNRKFFCRRWMSTFSNPHKYNHQETKIHPYTTIKKQKQYKTNKTSGRWMLTFSPLPIQGSIRKLKNVDTCFFCALS